MRHRGHEPNWFEVDEESPEFLPLGRFHRYRMAGWSSDGTQRVVVDPSTETVEGVVLAVRDDPVGQGW